MAGFMVHGSVRAENAPPSSMVPTGAPKSEFVDDPGVGKDPFFPKSGRRKFVPKTLDEPAPDPTVPDFIVLKGISMTEGKKLAIINNYTLGQGEEFSLKYNGQVIKVQCVEIKDKSVIISTGGATKEIQLRTALQ
jgi:hypothetical protein